MRPKSFTSEQIRSAIDLTRECELLDGDERTMADMLEYLLQFVEWRPENTAPQGVICDALFDPDSYDMPEFYCPSGKVTGLWRICHVAKFKDRWFQTDGLEAIGAYPIMAKITHWRELSPPPSLEKEG